MCLALILQNRLRVLGMSATASFEASQQAFCDLSAEHFKALHGLLICRPVIDDGAEDSRLILSKHRAEADAGTCGLMSHGVQPPPHDVSLQLTPLATNLCLMRQHLYDIDYAPAPSAN